MAHALTAFIEARMEELGYRQRDLVARSGDALSRALVSKYVNDKRPKITRLPDRATLVAFAKALDVPFDVLLARSIEALDVGYTAGDFVNAVATASDRELLGEIERRLEGGGARDRGAATNTPGDGDPVNNPKTDPGDDDGDEGGGSVISLPTPPKPPTAPPARKVARKSKQRPRLSEERDRQDLEATRPDDDGSDDPA